MELDHSIWVRSVRNSIVRSLTFFCQWEGSHLGHLGLQGALLTLSHGMKLLEAATVEQEHRRCRSAQAGMLSLDLQDFFSSSVTIPDSRAFLRVMWHFRGLGSLSLGYSCVSNKLLETLALSCRKDRSHAQVVSGMAWALLAQSCAMLGVHVHVEHINADQLGRNPAAGVPVRLLLQ
ncbi:hypothetical protein P4O66_005703, partial [Electrophorus voltai]